MITIDLRIGLAVPQLRKGLRLYDLEERISAQQKKKVKLRVVQVLVLRMERKFVLRIVQIYEL